MKKFLKPTFFLAILLLSLSSFAQDEDPDLPPGDPGAKAPINDYIPFFILGASVLGFYFIKKKESKSIS